jgi:hypothetical protein
MGNGPNFGSGPWSVIAIPSAAYTADPDPVTVENIGNFPIAQIFVSCTDSAATPSVVFNIDTENPKTGTFVELLDSAAVTGASENVYQIGGAGSESADLFSSLHPGRALRIRPVHADSDSITYSVVVSWLRN